MGREEIEARIARRKAEISRLLGEEALLRLVSCSVTSACGEVGVCQALQDVGPDQEQFDEQVRECALRVEERQILRERKDEWLDV